MRKKISYSYKICLNGRNGEVQNSQCECPAGKGPNATCKHIESVLLMIQKFVETGQLDVERSCTEGLQTFHKPRKAHTGSPVKAEDISSKVSCMQDDPRPEHFRHMSGYNDYVRNAVINYCAESLLDMTMRYLYPKVSLQAAVLDHDYLMLPFTEYWVDRSLQ
ncbi:PREDICTED: uncharacterized protein LOC106818373, partial [Priapulus caudatus]|uniref:Uncharacterized protein LOC106818373 n=1 Tax=Priapulus caudatus TaxID=37621 RepID=A0ABM1F2A4_PRICU